MAPKRKRKATAKTMTAKHTKTSQAPKDPAVTCLTEKGVASNYLQVLPAEIRLMIYSLAVVQDEPIRPVQIEHRSNKFKTASLLPKSQQQAVRTFTSLLLSSRFFYDEILAHPFFYRENEFAFPSVTSLHIFLSALTPARRSSLCHAGMVSSRTRGRMKRLETAGSTNGVIPGAKLNPKYLEVDEYQGEEDQ
ncbi:hypothetical protein K4K61_006888 [Colletotrichum sp. SAR11_59]|nr:hypothetical protein K4K61_006888 [Colletotrichum sp. SAR11_59]